MAIVFEVYTDENLNDYMMKQYGETEFEVISSRASEWTKNVSYKVKAFEGKVISIVGCNLGYFDDYRAGCSCIVACGLGYKNVLVNVENNDGQGAKVDASVEMQQGYRDHLAHLARKRELEKRWENRNEFIKASRMMGFNNYHVAKKLKNGLPDQYYYAVDLVEKFVNGKLRSEFRASLAVQIYNWLKEDNNRYKSPLSPKQASYLVPRKYY